ncbi:MAG: hypothetical protein WCJ40_16065, partial [Planctomycetota bacterium]
PGRCPGLSQAAPLVLKSIDYKTTTRPTILAPRPGCKPHFFFRIQIRKVPLRSTTGYTHLMPPASF